MLEANLTNKKETNVTGLFQWDYGQIVKVIGIEDTSSLEIHIGNDSSETYIVKSITVETGYFTFQIPDFLLQTAHTIKAYIYYDSGKEGKSRKLIRFSIGDRTKPEDYITPDDENYKYIVPKGGTTGQYLAKKSDADGDTEWRDRPDGGSGGASFNINSLTEENDLSDSDYLALYDTSATAHRKTLWSNIKAKLKANFDTLYSAIGHTHSEYIQEPTSEGTAGQVLMSDGNGGRSWGNVSGSTGGGLTTAQINALDGMFKIASYKENPTTAYNAFKEAFGITEGGDTPSDVTLTSISAAYTGGNVTVGTALTDLTGITVTATYSDGSTVNVTGYSLSGEITEGSNTITVTYQGKTTTFTVTGVVGEVTEPLYGVFWTPSPKQPWVTSNVEGTGYTYTGNTGEYVNAGLPGAASAKLNKKLQGHIYVRTLTKSQYAIDPAYMIYVNADGEISTGGFTKLEHTRHDKFNNVTETIDVNGTTYYFTMYEWTIPSDKVGIFVSKAEPMNNGQFISTDKISIVEEYKQYYTLFTSDPSDRITEGATEVSA